MTSHKSLFPPIKLPLTDYAVTDEQRYVVERYLERNWPDKQSGDNWLKMVGLKSAWLIARKADPTLNSQYPDLTKLTLKEQTTALGLHMEEVPLRRSSTGYVFGDDEFNKKEEAVAKSYQSEWAHCLFDEGASVRLFLGLLLIDYVNEIAKTLQIPISSTIKECIQWTFPHALRISEHLNLLFLNAPPDSKEGRLLEDILDYFCATTDYSVRDEEAIRKSIIALDSAVDPKSPGFDPRQYVAPYFLPFAHGIWWVSQSIDKSTLKNLIRKCLTCDITFSGWPDITLIGERGLGFCEVKDKDRLHQSQFEWWSEIAPLFEGNAWIGKIAFEKGRSTNAVSTP